MSALDLAKITLRPMRLGDWQRIHEWWGNGIAGEIARLLCRIGFEVLELERVEATCDPRNAASAAVLQRIGMTYEGTLRRTVLIREGWRDSKMHSLIRPDWTPPSTNGQPRWVLG